MSVQAGLRANPTAVIRAPAGAGGNRQRHGHRHRVAARAVSPWPARRRRGCGREVAEHEEAEARRQLARDVADGVRRRCRRESRELAITDEVLAAAISKQLELLRARAAQGAAPTLDRDMVDVEVRRIQAERSCRPDAWTAHSFASSGSWGCRLRRRFGSRNRWRSCLAARPRPTGRSVGDAAGRESLRGARPCRGAALVAARSEGRPDVTIFGCYMRMDAGFPQQAFLLAGASSASVVSSIT